MGEATLANDATDTELARLESKAFRKKTPAVIPEGAPWNKVEEAFLKRRSVRKYKRKQVPEHYIKRILEVGRFAASQGNCQPWKFIVVRDKDMIDEMEQFVLDQMQAMVSIPPEQAAEVIHPVPYSLLTGSPEGEGIKVFHGAPTLIFPLMDTRGIGHPEIDLGIVGTNIIMAACSLGLGTCWVGFAETLNSGDWPKKLGVEEPYALIEAIAVGYEVGNAQSNFVQRETHATTWFEGGKKRTMY
jgi:nitroreductase